MMAACSWSVAGVPQCFERQNLLMVLSRTRLEWLKYFG